MTMRRNSFTIPGNPSITVSLLERADGTILVTLTQSGTNVADIRGLFFDVTDAAVLSKLVVTGTQVTGSVFGNEAVTAVSGDVNMNGVNVAPFDAGISFGTSGIGGNDDIRSTSFVLSTNNGSTLTLDLLSNVDFGVRLTSVGVLGGKRTDSFKNITVSTAAPNAIDDLITTNEDSSKTGNLLANDTDANASDVLRVVEVNGVAANVGPQITLGNGALLTVNSNGSYNYNPNSKYEYLGVGESAQESFTYGISDGIAGYDTATATVTITGVNDAPDITVAAGNSASSVLTETNSGLTTGGTLTVTDVDITDLVTPSVISVTSIGATNGLTNAQLLNYLSVNPTPADTISTTTATLNWSFNSGNQAFNYLAVDKRLVLDYVVQVQDDSGSANNKDTQLVKVTINGTNDAPVAANDIASTSEDTSVTINVLANDTDVDATDILSVVEIVDTPNHGAVVINPADKTLTYTPNADYSGSDELTYRISDGNGGFSNAVVNLSVAAKADTPSLTVDVLQGSSINEVKLRIRSSLTDTDGSESLAWIVEGIPSDVAVTGTTSGSGSPVDKYITLTLPQNSDSNFNVVVKSTSTETLNGNKAVATVTKPIQYDATFNDFNRTFTATDQSMWDTGNAFNLTDSRFLGIDENYSDSFSAFLYGAWNINFKAGLQSDLELRGGSVDASLPYNIDFNTFYNRATDTLLIKPQASLLSGGSFSTDSPGGSYNLDFIFKLNGSVSAGLDFGALGKAEFFNQTITPVDETINLIDFDSDTDPSLTVDLPLGLSGTLAFPNVDTSSASSGGGLFTSSGASNNFLTLNLDVDQALADLFLRGVNPFDLSFSILTVSGSFELIDVDVLAGLNFLQNFALDVNDLDLSLKFENNTSQSVNFGEGLLLSNADSLDVDGDGLIEFVAKLAPDAEFTNDTNLGVNVGYNFDLIKGSYSDGLAISGSFGPLLDLGESFPVAAVDLWSNTFNLNFGSQSLSFAA
jgi:VCBS repeat-containing protein